MQNGNEGCRSRNMRRSVPEALAELGSPRVSVPAIFLVYQRWLAVPEGLVIPERPNLSVPG